MKRTYITSILLSGALACTLAGCATNTQAVNASEANASTSAVEATAADETTGADTSTSETSAAASAQAAPSSSQMPEAGMGGMDERAGAHMGGGMDTQPGQTTDDGFTATDTGIAITTTLNVADAFTERDLAQTADTNNASTYTVTDGKDITITEEGVYVITGTASETTIVVEASDTAKVQLVLDGLSITNKDFPAIYVKSADKVFVTLVGENTLNVTGEFVTDGETDTDAVIFSKDDLCLNGTGSLTITSTEHGVVSKDDLKVTGGTYTITAPAGSALRANDSVRIANGTFNLNAEDGIKAKNGDDNELGYVYIQDGSFTINGTDNGIQGYAFVWINGGSFTIDSVECIEGTYVQINDGKLVLTSSDDAINASIKSSIYTPTIEITGGALDITMAQGDTDALDSNGYLYIKGGTVNISAQSPFDYAWGGEITGGTVTVNGQQVTELYDSMMGGGPGGMDGFGGGRPGQDGQMPEGMDSSQRPTPPDFGNGERPQRPGSSQ